MNNSISSMLSSKFKQPTEPIVHHLLDRFDNGLPKQLTRQSYNKYCDLCQKQEFQASSSLNSTPDQFRVQQELFRNTEYAYQKNLIEQSKVYADDFSECLNEFHSQLHTAKLSLELTYRTSNVIQLPTELLSVLQLENVSTARQTKLRLLALTSVVNQLFDLRAILHDPVIEVNHPGDTLSKVQLLLSNEKSLILGSDFYNHDLNPHVGVEHCRLLTAGISAKDSEYTSMNCAELFTLICKLTTGVENLRTHWVSDKSTYSDNECRLRQLINDIPNLRSDQDQLNTSSSVPARLNRIYSVMNVITHVVYPCVLKELTELTKVYETLGQYKYLNGESTPAVKKNYALEKLFQDQIDYLGFLQSVNNTHTANYIVKGIEYCNTNLDHVLETSNKSKQMFAAFKEDTPLSVQETANICPVQYTQNYLDAWIINYKTWNDYLTSVMSVQTPLTSWKTIDLNNQYATDLSNLWGKTLSKELNIDCVGNYSKSFTITPTLYKSPVRIGRENTTMIKTTMLGYHDVNQQKELKQKVTQLREQLLHTKLNLGRFSELVKSFQVDNSDPLNQKQMSICYNMINDLLGQFTFTDYDLTFLNIIYSR